MNGGLGTLRFADLTASEGDVARLERFYAGAYVAEFPDPDERESLENMREYLALDGRFGNAYFVTLLYDGDAIAGGCIGDYFMRSQCGAIEFLAIAASHRKRGFGSLLAAHLEERMLRAGQARREPLRFIMAEMNDPFKRSRVPDHVDPFARLHFWSKLGYARAAFPYVQPPLSAEQEPVRNLLLAVKPVATPNARVISSAVVVAFLRDYLTYAMRFEDPARSSEFRAMATYLDGCSTLPLASLDAYAGADRERPLDVRPIDDANDRDFAPVMALYRRAFTKPETAVREAEFAAQLASHRADVSYHLWALRAAVDGDVCGMASFFGLAHAGFGGYVALEAPLRGTGRLAPLLARMERQLVADGDRSEGWYIECEDDATATLFAKHGFHRIALDYRQPPLHGSSRATPPLRLLYKQFGASFAPPHLAKSEFQEALAEIGDAVYHLSPSQRGSIAAASGGDVQFVRDARE